MWNNIKEMFPSGHIDYLNQDIDEITDEVEKISFNQIEMARNMVIKIDQLTWLPNGKFYRKNLYNVYPTSSPDNLPCLNVYGAKMITEFLWRKNNIPGYRKYLNNSNYNTNIYVSSGEDA